MQLSWRFILCLYIFLHFILQGWVCVVQTDEHCCYICNIFYKILSCIIMIAVTNHSWSESGKIFIEHLHHQIMGCIRQLGWKLGWGVSYHWISPRFISCCKSHSCVKNSLCNLGDASSRFSGLLLVALFLTASNFLYTVQSIILHIYAKARGCFLTVHATISYVNSSICFKFPVIALPL